MDVEARVAEENAGGLSERPGDQLLGAGATVPDSASAFVQSFSPEAYPVSSR